MWNKLQSLFFLRADCCIGVFARESKLFLTVRFSPAYDREPISDRISLDASEVPADYFAEIAAQIKLYCIREGIRQPGIIFCLPQRDVFQYKKSFPAMEAKELREALRWDAEANVPFREGTYNWDFICCQEENEFLLCAAEKSLLQCLQAAFLDEELFLCGITAEPDAEFLYASDKDMNLSLEQDAAYTSENQHNDFNRQDTLIASWAARNLEAKKAYLNLLPDTGKSYKPLWNRIAVISFISSLLVLCIIYFFNSQELGNLERQRKENEYQLSLLQRDIENKAEAERLLQCSREKNKILSELSQKNFSWYGILVHLGTMTVDKVWLTDLSFQQEQLIQLRGKADDYGALAAFLKQFEEKSIIFSEKPVLQNANIDNNGSIDFSILVRLKER